LGKIKQKKSSVKVLESIVPAASGNSCKVFKAYCPMDHVVIAMIVSLRKPPFDTMAHRAIGHPWKETSKIGPKRIKLKFKILSFSSKV